MERLKFAVYLALIIAFLPSPLRAALNSEAGAFVFRTYSAKDYSASPQNWSIVQDPHGVLYFGNTEGILSYDSVNWKMIRMPNGAVAQSLALAANGIVYVGGVGEFGYLETGPKGLTRFTSLLPRLPLADRRFGRVWDVIPRPEGIYFGAFERVFRLNPDGSVSIFRPAGGNFNRIFLDGDHIYISTAQNGFFRIAGNNIVPGPSARHFTEPGVVGTCQSGGVTTLASSSRLYRLVGDSMEPFQTEMDGYLRTHEIYSLFALRTGDIAVGTHTGGLVLLTNSGKLDRLIDKAAGAPGNGITSLYPDREGGVWLTTDDSGIARFDPSLTRFGVLQGVDGLLSTIHRYNGWLYAGGTKGLYRLNDKPGKAPSFTLFSGVNELVAVMMDYEAIAFVGAQHGLYALSGDKLQRVLDTDIYRQVWDLAKSDRELHVIYTAGRDGVCMLRQTGQTWNLADKVSEAEEFRTVAEDPDGRVWATTENDIWRIDFRSRPPKAERFTRSDGVPASWKSVYRFRGHIVFATQKGLMTFAAADRRFVPDTEARSPLCRWSHGVSLLNFDPERNIWITGARL